MHIFIDLDGVLSNFCQAVVDLCLPGNTDKAVMEQGRVLDPNAHPFKQLELGLGRSSRDIWGAIAAAGSGFWENMHELPAARELWTQLNDAMPGQVSILTSPGRGLAAVTSSASKYRWVLDHLGEDATYQTIICPAPLKHHLATHGYGPNLLIDDYDKNVKQWQASAGHAIHWPSLQFCSRHADASDVEAAMRIVADLAAGGAA